MKRVVFTSAGDVKVRFSYVCPDQAVPQPRTSRIEVSQRSTATKNIAHLVVCDETIQTATARVANDEGLLVATKPIYASVGITVTRASGAGPLLLSNGKSILVEPPG